MFQDLHIFDVHAQFPIAGDVSQGGARTRETGWLDNPASRERQEFRQRLYIAITRAFDATEAIVRLLDAALSTAEFDVELLAERAGSGRMTPTALADALVRDHGLPFRTAHRIVSDLVKQGGTTDATAVASASQQVLGHALTIDDLWREDTLDLRRFVEARTLPGGPAPTATMAAISSAQDRLRQAQSVTAEAERRLNSATNDRAGRIDAILS